MPVPLPDDVIGDEMSVLRAKMYSKYLGIGWEVEDHFCNQ